MSLRKEQCNKVCRILDDVLANRPTERDSLIVAVRKAFEALDCLSPAEPRKGHWSIEDCHAATYKYCCSECKAHHRARYDFCPTCGAKMEESE